MNWKNATGIIDGILKSASRHSKDDIEAAWKSIEESKYASIVTFIDGELILKTENSTYLQILTYKLQEIKRKLNEKLSGIVTDIKLRLGG
ncbi:MAG: DciA family protein [Elusimicrobiota bacterium]